MQPVRLDRRAASDHQALWVRSAYRVQLGFQVQSDHRAKMVFLDHRDNLVHLETLVRQDRMDLLDKQDPLDQQVLREKRDSLVHLDHWDHRDPVARQVNPVRLVNQDLQVLMARLDHLDK